MIPCLTNECSLGWYSVTAYPNGNLMRSMADVKDTEKPQKQNKTKGHCWWPNFLQTPRNISKFPKETLNWNDTLNLFEVGFTWTALAYLPVSRGVSTLYYQNLLSCYSNSVEEFGSCR